ncbi:MAG TPA: cupin domain-containing protein [Candidatus Saccharimonadales bacterium]|nr:cupin domain-containing protein [Candidatus Saccharimonadales bacterium]
MSGYVVFIERETMENANFRKVLFTAKHSQLVLMSLRPGEEIGAEVHHLDQFIRVESGEGKAILDGEEHVLNDGTAVVVPEGVKHNIINTSTTEPMKLYTVYSPPEHRDGVVHETKEAALKDEQDHYQA